jgi:RNA polymerase sigma-70 factor (ECF subfamily)
VNFELELVELIPELRAYSRRSTGSADLANDLVQDTVVRALEKQETFQPGTNLRAWAYTILRNLMRDRGRRIVRQGPHFGIDMEDVPLASQPSQEQQLQYQDFARAFDRLPGHQRWILLRVGPEGESYDSVARRLGVAVGTVKSRVSRARANLRAIERQLEQPAQPAH